MADRIKDDLARVREILALWDPIGVIEFLREEGLPPNEYDSYAPAILTMLHGGTSREAIVQHLGRIQKSSMGLNPLPDRDAWIADQLLEWRSRGR